MFVKSNNGIKIEKYLILIIAVSGTCALIALFLNILDVDGSLVFTSGVVSEIDAYLR